VDFTIKSRSPSQCNERHSGTTFNAVCSLFGTVSLALGLAYFSLYLAFSLSFAVHRTHPALLPFIHSALPSHIQLGTGSCSFPSLALCVFITHDYTHTDSVSPLPCNFYLTFCAPLSSLCSVLLCSVVSGPASIITSTTYKYQRYCPGEQDLVHLPFHLTPAPTRKQTMAKAFLLISFSRAFLVRLSRGLAGLFRCFLKGL